jgi:dTDP-4-dehydrorhamnose 3,5-epimerase
VLDVIVDLRVGSPTFGRWQAVTLDDVDRRAVYVAEGLGHAFMALTGGATVAYLCSEVYSPSQEFAINPFDPEIGIKWPAGYQLAVSPKDQAAPLLKAAQDVGLLPAYQRCRDYYAALRNASNA